MNLFNHTRLTIFPQLKIGEMKCLCESLKSKRVARELHDTPWRGVQAPMGSRGQAKGFRAFSMQNIV